MSESMFYDCFGRELQGQTCEYCAVTKPVSHWSGIENGKDAFTVLMIEYTGRDGHIAWMCKECYTDIQNKLEGKSISYTFYSFDSKET